MKRSLIFFALAAAVTSGAQTVYMDNLNSPRGLFIDADGTVFVAEAGTGGAPDGPMVTVGAGLSTYGLTGGVTKRLNNGPQERIFSNLPSLATVANGEAVGAHDILRTNDGRLAVLIGMGGNVASRASLGSTADRFGTLSIYDPVLGTWTIDTDYLAKEGADNPDGNPVLDSDPFGFAHNGSGFAVADAGANAVWIGSSYTAFSSRMTPNPFNPSTNIPMQSVPTSIVARPGGGWMVGELTGFPFVAGEARLHELAADGTLIQSLDYDLTNVIDLAYDSLGDLLILEHSSTGILTGGNGSLKRLHNGVVSTVISDLLTPTSFALSNDGFVYITSDTYAPGVGQVLRYDYAPVPEPTTIAALCLGVTGFLRRRRK
ncbi:PEP-CTERM sorting domain-containing protein [bacterium]|nr:MAG: PEP-CTERM sorting domain-containing protein [bacterium]